MNIIECLLDKINDELDDAEEYINNAVKLKDDYPEVASVFHALASEEITHMERLHNTTTMIIREYAKEKEMSSEMQAVYEYEHRRYVNRANAIKYLISSNK